MSNVDCMVKVSNLRKSFDGLDALNGVSFSVDRGKVVVILGPSGSGKSTLLRCINQLEHQDSGEVWIDGEQLTSNPKQLDRIRSEMGMVFQHFNLYPHLTVLENLTLAQRLVRKTPREEAEEFARQQLKRVGILDKANATPAQLPEVNSRGLPLPGRCLCAPNCSSLMNPPALSTPK